MPMLRCAYCGESFVGKTGQRFCSWDCYCKDRLQHQSTRPSHQKKAPGLDGCQFNEGVSCFPAGDCTKCGWNPKVAQKRMERILAKLLGAEEVLADGG